MIYLPGSLDNSSLPIFVHRYLVLGLAAKSLTYQPLFCQERNHLTRLQIGVCMYVSGTSNIETSV
jgi:hypothetical protein